MADRVIILDVRRAGEELRARDIKQMFGRAGRVHVSNKKAHVHIVLPDVLATKWNNKINDPMSYEVISQLNNVEALSFHVISHVVRGIINDEDSFNEWYSRTFDYAQRRNRKQHLPNFDEIANELHRTGTAKYNKLLKTLKPRPLGRVCASFYFSPQDVCDWFINISKLSKKNLLFDDLCQAWCLANVTSALGWESDTIKSESSKIVEHVTGFGLKVKPGVCGRMLATNCVLSGYRPKCELPEMFAVKNDLSRVISAVSSICECGKRIWGNQVGFSSSLSTRLKYGVSTKLVSLVSLEGIGKTTAKELLYTYDIINKQQLLQNKERIYKEATPSVKRALTRFLKTL